MFEALRITSGDAGQQDGADPVASAQENTFIHQYLAPRGVDEMILAVGEVAAGPADVPVPTQPGGPNAVSFEREEEELEIRLDPRPPAFCPLDDFDNDQVATFAIEGMTKVCHYCGAKKFANESVGMCCKKGQVQLAAMNEMPEELCELFKNDHFKRAIRKYNSAFAFTSMGVKVDDRLANERDGVYTFRIQGQLHHKIGSLMPNEGEEAKFCQIYFYEEAQQVERRQIIFPALEAEICFQLTGMMERLNPYVHVYKQVREQQASRLSLKLLTNSGMDLRRYNCPTADEVAVLMIDSDERTRGRDVVLTKRNGYLQKISEISRHYDPLQYPLLFPRGESGWHPDIKLSNGKRLTQKQWAAYYLQVRSNVERNPLFLAGKLFQQFIVDQYAKMEQNRLNFFRTNQRKIRAELYQGIQDSLAAGEGTIGRRIVLPSSFTGGPRQMTQLYQDAMAVVRKFGKPDLFITVTCNPHWPEIVRELLPGQTAQDRPDIVVRVFNQKLKAIMKDITVKGAMGKVKAHVHVIEFQKRGLPHAHILLIMDSGSKFKEVADYDKVVAAEIPNPVTQPRLHELVTKHMIHGPCGALNRSSVCMQKIDGSNHCSCSKEFPKATCQQTRAGADGYPVYQRRGKFTTTKKVKGSDVTLDDRWVVPYNPYLLQKYNCHINVEVCSSFSSVKYLYKYVYKGHDRAGVTVGEETVIDEIQQYLDARYVSACEAAWRIFEFDLHGQSHAIYRLPVHLEDQQPVTFSEDADMVAILENRAFTKLTQFFHTCALDPFARDLTYVEFPLYYVWTGKDWKRREREHRIITRMYSVSPGEAERFHLRLLLAHVKGPSSFKDLRTYEGITYNTYKEAAAARGLIDNEREFEDCLTEAEVFAAPSQLRHLFATILVQCNPANVGGLWQKFYESMSDDFGQFDEARRRSMAANEVRKYLLQCGKQWAMYPDLPPINEELLEAPENPGNLIMEETSYDPIDILRDLLKVDMLNPEQRDIFEMVKNAVLMDDDTKHFFVDGPGGSGKTFLYSAIISYLRHREKIVLVVASSGIAAYLLQGGRTAHSRFKIPLDLSPESMCRISVQSNLCGLIRRTSLIIWDEIPMMHKYAVEALDRTLRDLMGNDEMFGGIPVLFGGDFRQILPVVIKGSRGAIVNSSLKRSYIWRSLKVCKLTTNQRVNEGQDLFAEYLLKVGEGKERTYPALGQDYIQIPDDMLIANDDIKDLIDETFPDLHDNLHDTDYLVRRAILTPKNSDVDMLNEVVASTIEEGKKNLKKRRRGGHDVLEC